MGGLRYLHNGFNLSLDSTMRTLMLFALFCPLLQGCVGVVVLKSHTEVIRDPVIAFYPNDADPAHKRNSREETNAVVYTSEWLETHWDSPHRVVRVSGGSDEVWTYRFRSIWEGIVPCVIVPIPLALPVGRQNVCFTLRDGRVVSASTTTPWMVGRVAGFMLSPEGGGNFGAGSLNQQAPN
jgi:hypothetical protein